MDDSSKSFYFILFYFALFDFAVYAGMYVSRQSRIDNCLFIPSDETLQKTRKEVNQSWSRRVTRYKWELSCGVHEILLSPQKE